MLGRLIVFLGATLAVNAVVPIFLPRRADPVPAMLVVYTSPHFEGYSKIFRGSVDDLRNEHGRAFYGLGNWNDEIQSFRIVSGRWVFYEGLAYAGAATRAFGPGNYGDERAHGIPPAWISSIRSAGP